MDPGVGHRAGSRRKSRLWAPGLEEGDSGEQRLGGKPKTAGCKMPNAELF